MISDEALLKVLFYIVGLSICVAFAWLIEFFDDFLWSDDE